MHKNSKTTALIWIIETIKTWISNTFFSNWVKIRQKKGREQMLLRISSGLIWCNLFSENLNQNFTPKLVNFGFFHLIKNYVESILLIDEEYVSQEASYTAQQNSRRVNSPKNWVTVWNLFLIKNFGFYIVKITFLDYQAKIFSLKQGFADSTLLKICWAVQEASCGTFSSSINKIVSA